MLTVLEVAKELKVHPQSVYRWIYQGRLLAVRAGGRLRVREEDLQSFLVPEEAGSQGKEGQKRDE